MSDEFGMRSSDFTSHDTPTLAGAVPRAASSRGVRGYPEALPRSNLILVRDHLQNALHAMPNAEAQKYIILAIKELER